MAKRIESLSPDQWEQVGRVRDKWLAAGFSTQPADRPAAEAGVRAAYKAVGAEPPMAILWVDSPLAGAYARVLVPLMLGAKPDQLWGQLWGQLGDQLRGQLWDQLGDQLRDQLGGQLGDQLRGQLWDQLGDQLRDQLGDQLGGQLGDQLRGQLWDQLGGQLWDQLGDQLRGQLGDQLGDQLWGQLWGQLGDQLRGQLWDQLGDQLRGQLRGQLGGQLRGQLRNWYRGLIDSPWLQIYSGWFEGGGVAGVSGLEQWDGHSQVAASAGWWWAFPQFAILTERPSEIHRDAQGRLHNEAGPAVLWRDGWATHAWHGTRVPPDLIETGGWDTRRIFEERNTEIRRCAIERVGWAKFVAESGMELVAEAPDPGNAPHLLSLYDLPAALRDMYGEPARILVCVNGSQERDGTRRTFGLPVPAHHSRPIEAAADLYGIPAHEYRRISVRR